MFVILFMAANAILGRLLEHRTLVAIFADHFEVLAKQRETAFFVVKAGALFPASLIVATGAILAQ